MLDDQIDAVLTMGDEKRRQCLLSLRKLLLDDEKLRLLQSDDVYLERYLYTTNFNIEKAFHKLKLFYDLLEECPEWHANGPLHDKEDIIKKDIRILTTAHDKEGRPVYIVRIGNMNSKTMDLVNDVVAVDDFFMELLLRTDPEFKNGLCVIADIANFPWNLIKWLTPHNIKTALRRMATMPLKTYKYHVVNTSMVLTVAVNIIWPFLPQHIKEGVYSAAKLCSWGGVMWDKKIQKLQDISKVKFHFNDRESLHEYIDPGVLPPEYGGTSDVDYKVYSSQIFDKKEEIEASFKINRTLYLQQIEKLTDT